MQAKKKIHVQRIELEIEFDPETQDEPASWNWNELTGNICTVMDAWEIVVVEGFE